MKVVVVLLALAQPTARTVSSARPGRAPPAVGVHQVALVTAIVFPVGSLTRVPRGSDRFTGAPACEEAGAGLDRSDVLEVSPEPHPPPMETMTSDIAARVARVQISEFTIGSPPPPPAT